MRYACVAMMIVMVLIQAVGIGSTRTVCFYSNIGSWRGRE
jgi:hypothetical protein